MQVGKDRARVPRANGHECSKNGGRQAQSRRAPNTARFSGHVTCVTPLFDIKIAPLLQPTVAFLFPHPKSRSPHPSPRVPALPHPPCARPFAAKCERGGERRDLRTDANQLPLGCNLLLGAIASCQRQEVPSMQAHPCNSTCQEGASTTFNLSAASLQGAFSSCRPSTPRCRCTMHLSPLRFV